MVRMKWIIVYACLISAIIMGGREAGSETVPRTVKREPFLLIGLIPEQNIFKQIERYEPVAKYLVGIDHGHEGVGIDLMNKVLQHGHFPPVNHGVDDGPVAVIVHALSLDEGPSPVQVVDDLIPQFLGFVGNDELIR